MKPQVKAFFDKDTFTVTYVVWDEKTMDGVVIDSVLDYDPIGSKIGVHSYNEVKDYLKNENINLKMVLETHAHADHISAAPLFKKDFGDVPVAIGEKITLVQDTFKSVFNLEDNFKVDGSQFDLLLKDEQVINAGSLEIKTLHTPGHTPACASYVIGDAVFTGDAMFMPDFGTGRCDFPKGDADALFQSITTKLFTLPDETRVFVGHDYLPNGREVKWETTIKEEKENNIQLNASSNKEDFVTKRKERDAKLKAPKLIYQSIQANIDAGHLPVAEENGKKYFKVPISE